MGSLMFELWAIRNGEVHGTTTATRVQAQRPEANRQLTDLFASRDFMEPPVWELLAEDPEAQMQRPKRTAQNWLAMAGPVVIRQSIRRVKKVSLQGVRSLRAYIPRTGNG